MKVELFNRELEFYNSELYEAAKLADSLGYKVHTFNPSGNYIRQIFIDNGKTFGSVSEYYGGVQYSTCHKSEYGSGNGTGFGMSDMDIETASEEGLQKCFVFAPRWARNTSKIKKQTWEEYASSTMGKILTYSQIKF